MKARELLEAKKQHKPSEYRVEFQNMGSTDRLQQAAMYAKQYCSQYIQACKKPAVVRGSNSRFDAAVINPAVVGRESANTSNEYTILLSSLPNWSKFPKRSQSIICSNSVRTADAYGNIYAVVLPDKFKVGVCPSSDIWNSFHYLGQQTSIFSMDSFNGQLQGLLSNFGSPADNIEEIQDGCYELDLAIKEFKKTKKPTAEKFVMHLSEMDNVENLATYLYNSNTTSFKTIAKLLDPKLNGFAVTSNLSDLILLPREHELWTSTSCLLVDFDMYAELRERVLSRA